MSRFVDEGSLRCLDLSLEQTGYRHLRDGLDARLLVPVDLVDADIVLSVPGRSERGHIVVGVSLSVGGGELWVSEEEVVSYWAANRKCHGLR